jgi:pimeloyl-ACP methyl ester carboxylesterase
MKSRMADQILSRRRLIQGMLATATSSLVPMSTRAVSALGQTATAAGPDAVPYAAGVLPPGIRSRFISNVNGLRMHVLEAGFELPDHPLLVLLHGFPELAYSWRKVMLPLASSGFHVIAPDRRGYGRTSGWDVRYDDALDPFGTLNQVRDVLALVSAFGYRTVRAVIGHDQGSPMAAWCAVTRPDVFRSAVMMSAPFAGPPTLPFKTADLPAGGPAPPDPIYAALAKLNPPRKYYMQYYATRQANENLWHPPQGLHAFLRAYYHMKSADWMQNRPFPLKDRTAEEWAKLPRYYVMDLDKGMAETVAVEMPSPAAIATCRWLPDSELDVYTGEYGRTGFQVGLEGYRVRFEPKINAELQLFSGRTIDVPAMFIAGASDWGAYQTPGDLERLETTVCTQYRGTHFVPGAGHWVQQEQPEAVSELLLRFVSGNGS